MKIILLTTLLMALSASIYLAAGGETTELTDCPSSEQDWLKWKDNILSQTLATQFSRNLNLIHLKLKKCQKNLEVLGPKKQCFDHLFDFTEQKFRSHQKNFTLGVEMSDSEYFYLAPSFGADTLPKELLSQEFLSALDHPKDKDFSNVISLIDRYNQQRASKMIAFPYTSRHLESVDDAKTFWRFFIWIPGSKTDMVAQFGVGTSVESEQSSIISIIAVKSSEKGKKKVFYNDLWRQRENGEISVVTRYEINGRSELCYTCHKSPFIPIVPEPDSFNFERFGLSLSQANMLMSQYSGGKYVGITPDHFGPGMGIRRNLTKAEIIECSQELDFSPDEFQQIREGVKCQSCHDGHQRGILNFPSGLSHQVTKTDSLVELFVHNYQLMPPTMDELNSKVRKGIFQCLVYDYYGDFQSVDKGRLTRWLANDQCFEKQ